MIITLSWEVEKFWQLFTVGQLQTSIAQVIEEVVGTRL